MTFAHLPTPVAAALMAGSVYCWGKTFYQWWLDWQSSRTPSRAVQLTADIIVVREDTDSILLVRRAHEPFAGHWALPGGRVEPACDGDVESAARRELKEETNVDSDRPLTLFTAIANNHRDPRAFTATFVYVLLLTGQEADELTVRAGDDASQVAFWPLSTVAKSAHLAFDHLDVLEMYTAHRDASLSTSRLL